MSKKSMVVFGLLGLSLDGGVTQKRWERWRPTLSLCQHEDLLVHRLELLFPERYKNLAETLTQDIQSVSPETEVCFHIIEQQDPWDFEEVYAGLHDFGKRYKFDTDSEDYLVHITTGTHVAQICLYLLTETHYFPAKLLQTSPPARNAQGEGEYRIIDLDLSRYDRIASRFQKEHETGLSFLKSGIETNNAQFNTLIEKIERVAIHSKAPILLTGPTGAGKSQLARKIFELKKSRRQVEGEFVEVNCATLRGDAAMSTLFGHVKGSFTGALQDRSGLLSVANGGILFLDEIGELGLDEQAMLLRALEEKRFLPMGADRESESDFQLIAGTNRHLPTDVKTGKFREDLLARINLWAFKLPGLRDRPEDLEPNLNYELEKFASQNGQQVTFNKEAKSHFLKFATSSQALWSANFRDLNAAVTRMSTLSQGGRITLALVEEEIELLQESWLGSSPIGAHQQSHDPIISEEDWDELDLFDQIQLPEVLRVCRQSQSMAEAGRTLFSKSRLKKKQANDSDRLRKYLTRFGLDWKSIQGVS